MPVELEDAKLALECLLFVGNEPLPESLLMDIMEVDRKMLRKAIDALSADLEGRSLQLVEVAGGLRMMTRQGSTATWSASSSPADADQPRETRVAIVAYRQPITRPEIDAIRGVNSSGSMESLLRKGAHQGGRPKERAGPTDHVRHHPDLPGGRGAERPEATACGGFGHRVAPLGRVPRGARSQR